MKPVVVAAAVLALSAVSARADEGTDFITKVLGTWSGGGTISASPGDAPGKTNCTLTATGGDTRVNIAGSCDGAGRGANLNVALTWVPATKQFTGTFTGAAESGTARLSGKVSGSSVSLAYVSSSGARSTLTFRVSGSSATLTASGKDAASGKSMTWVTLALKKG